MRACCTPLAGVPPGAFSQTAKNVRLLAGATADTKIPVPCHGQRTVPVTAPVALDLTTGSLCLNPLCT